jgi:16S rRNA processing protein RimM
LERAWVHNGRQVLKFAGIDTISAAERLSGAWVEIEADEAVSLPDGTYFDHDLIGCTAYDGAGRNLGMVTDILHIAGNDQLIVNGEHGEYLVPANETICKEVCIAEKRILLDPPPGLIDLNR